MISRIPTPNTHVDTSMWPVVKVTLGNEPSEDEYRVSLGRLRALRTRSEPHFIIVDARQLRQAPKRYVEMRLCTFVFESAELGQGGAVGVSVIATDLYIIDAIRALQRSCNRADSQVVVGDIQTALAMAGNALPGGGARLFELISSSTNS